MYLWYRMQEFDGCRFSCGRLVDLVEVVVREGGGRAFLGGVGGVVEDAEERDRKEATLYQDYGGGGERDERGAR